MLVQHCYRSTLASSSRVWYGSFDVFFDKTRKELGVSYLLLRFRTTIHAVMKPKVLLVGMDGTRHRRNGNEGPNKRSCQRVDVVRTYLLTVHARRA